MKQRLLNFSIIDSCILSRDLKQPHPVLDTVPQLKRRQRNSDWISAKTVRRRPAYKQHQSGPETQ
jgi:hypothetical protein